MGKVVRLALGLAVVAALVAAGQAVAVPGQAVAAPRFRVTYAGSGTYETVYHAQPANPGGNPDHNFADDSSTQKWTIRFTRPLLVGSARSLSGATGKTRIAAKIDHVHKDGLYQFDDRTVRCRLHAAAAPGAVALDVRATQRAVVITAANPLAQALLALPSSCPSQGDSVDGINDNYLEPGFSFAPGYGADRWYRSAPVTIPLSRLRSAGRIIIHLHDTRADRPPRHCAVPHPRWQQCRTGGRWSATLTLSKLG